MTDIFATRSFRGHRAPVLLAATVVFEGTGEFAVRIRNLSERGALVESEHSLPEGSTCWFCRKELRHRGRIVWTVGRHAGIVFEGRLDPAELLRTIPKPRTKAQLSFRRPGFTSKRLTMHDRRMLETWLASKD